MPRRLSVLAIACVFAPACLAQQAQGGFVSSNAGPNPFSGININTFIGADRFYSNGYTGSRSVIANIEAGNVWSGHESLTHTAMLPVAPGFGATQLGQADRHATWCGAAIGGRVTAGGGEYQRGIAYGSELWSGAIATSWSGSPYSTGFSWSNNNTYLYPYLAALQTGMGGRTADVVSSSWGYLDRTNVGYDVWTRAMDAVIAGAKKAVLFCAGNDGALGTNTIWGPATGHNAIVVGSVGSDTSNPAYGTVSSFSSRGPEDYRGPDGFAAGARARVDLVAPGQNLTLAHYGGATGGNTGGSSNLATNLYNTNLAGTSFATPTVAGAIGLLTDLAYDRWAPNANSRDGRVLKAVAMNSATKLGGWSNGQTVQGDGSILTTQALDFNLGAGRINLFSAFDQFASGTTDVAGTGGGNVQSLGWDFASVTSSAPNVYVFDSQLAGGSSLTATLCWYVKRNFLGIDPQGAMNVTDEAFDNLTLELYRVVNGNLTDLVAKSDARYITTQHFSVVLPQTGSYALKVSWTGARYGGSISDDYGLAWSATPVPEPVSALSVAVGALSLLRRRRPRSE